MMKDIPQDEMVRRAKIDELLHEEADSLFVNYCPHKIVDALLYHKSLIMKSHGIDYSIVAAVPAELNLDGYAILSVLSNLIDNAIEAVLALDKDRVIDIHLHTRANVLVCQVENTIPAHAALVKGRSTKKRPKTARPRPGDHRAHMQNPQWIVYTRNRWNPVPLHGHAVRKQRVKEVAMPLWYAAALA